MLFVWYDVMHILLCVSHDAFDVFYLCYHLGLLVLG